MLYTRYTDDIPPKAPALLALYANDAVYMTMSYDMNELSRNQDAAHLRSPPVLAAYRSEDIGERWDITGDIK